jgi:hypothetical protein
METSSASALLGPPGLPSPSTPVARSSGDIKDSQPTPSKKRRERLIRLSESKYEKAKYQIGVQTVERMIDVDDMKGVKEKVDRLEKKMDQQAEATRDITVMLQSLIQSSRKPCATSMQEKEETKKDEDSDTDIMDSVYCMMCEKIHYGCTCGTPAMEKLVCVDDECGYKQPLYRLDASEVARILSNDVSNTPHEMNMQCPQCCSNSMVASYNMIETERICEECVGIGDQDNILQEDNKRQTFPNLRTTIVLRFFIYSNSLKNLLYIPRKNHQLEILSYLSQD